MFIVFRLSYNESVRRSLSDLEQQSLGKSDMTAFQFNILNDFLMGKGAPSFLLDGYIISVTTKLYLEYKFYLGCS